MGNSHVPRFQTTTASRGGDPHQPWRQHAACRDADPALFEPREFEGTDIETFPQFRRRLQIATDFCNTCPVLADCFTYAVERDAWGVWAGQVWKNGQIVTNHEVKT